MPICTSSLKSTRLSTSPRRPSSLLIPLGKRTIIQEKFSTTGGTTLKGWREGAEAWQVETVHHNKQQDASSCRVLVMKFAENFITEESTEVVTTVEALHEYRKQIACSRLQNPGDAKDYCIVCALLECDPEHSMIGMVQCGTCHQWAHLECAKYTDEENYTCPKCL
ncbi:E3 ubiquitin-protein ligase SHPRH-like [Cololabis saira]|uniref:E3 ubiquitin-protein ligase SHPRH-like n=1 Tax=Cololabis saira TaxID=129043 RepID=UPI002AD42E92|nr:E3 ubiquitin-protein ligase SHPRH-like [Cololabis saira]